MAAQFEKEKNEQEKIQESQNTLQQKIIENTEKTPIFKEVEKNEQTIFNNKDKLKNNDESNFEITKRHKRILEKAKNKKGKSITF